MSDMSDKNNGYYSFRLDLIDWDCILKDVLKSWWMIVLAALTAALLVGGLQELRYTPRYQSSTTFIVGRAGFSNQRIYDNLVQAETTTKQYKQVVDSSILRSRVCEELGMESFDASVSVKAIESTNLMVMTVTAGSPREAFLLNRSVRKNALDLMRFFMEGVTMKELEAANIPSQPINPMNLRGDMRRAGLLGAAAMVAILAMISNRKDTIKNPEDISRKVDAKLLGTIYHEKKRPSTRKRAKRRRHNSLLLDNPMLSFGFLESYRMLASRVRLALDKSGKKILMITSVTENEGKSTVSSNLAIALAQSGKKVLLVDCDFRKPSLYRIFEKKVTEEQDFTESIRKRSYPQLLKFKPEPNLFLILCRKSRGKSWDQDSLEFMVDVLRKLSGKLDYVIVDSGPMALVSDSEEYAGWTDASMLVIHHDRMEASYINDAIDNLEDTGTELIGCALNGMRRGVVGRAREHSRYYGSSYGNYSHYSHYRTKPTGGGERKT